MRSNAYTYKFIIIVTGIAAFLLALASTGLKDLQDFNKQLDTRKNILKSVGEFDSKMSAASVEDAFNQLITEKYVNEAGDLAETENNFKVFVYRKNGKIRGYVLPVSGKGLWSTIKGFFAVGPDKNTVLGITFYEHGETPGLGGEIEKDWFTVQFPGKKIFDSNHTLRSITIAKGKSTTTGDYHVDGISGATLTTKGVNDFLLRNLKKYEKFLSQDIHS